MTRAIAQVTLFRDGALPEDNVVNTLHFEDDAEFGGGAAGFGEADPFQDDGPGLLNRIQTFYATVGPLWLGAQLSGQAQIKLYAFADPKPRIPRRVHDFSFRPANSALPGEVAICISMRAEAKAGANAQRRRGRIYLGPLSQSVAGLGDGSPDVRPDLTACQALADNFAAMAHGGAGSFRLAVYSPTTDSVPGRTDDAWNDVKVIHVDNAFDSIRKRGAKATLRASRALTG